MTGKDFAGALATGNIHALRRLSASNGHQLIRSVMHHLTPDDARNVLAHLKSYREAREHEHEADIKAVEKFLGL